MKKFDLLCNTMIILYIILACALGLWFVFGAFPTFVRAIGFIISMVIAFTVGAYFGSLDW